MTTTIINNIHNLKYFDKINELLEIKDIKVFANEINDLYKIIEQYRKQNDIYVKIIDDYEMERQYLLDKIAELSGTNNIYIFDKEEEYNDIQIQEEKKEYYNTIPENFINTNENIIIEEKKEQQEDTYIYATDIFSDYNIKNDEEFLKRKDNKSPLNKYNSLEDYINKFSIYDKEDKKAVKKAIVEDFKKAGFKAKVNNGYYYSLDVIVEVKKEDIIDKDVYNKAKKDLLYLYDISTINNYYHLNINKDISLSDKENIDVMKEYFEKRIYYNKYSSVEVKNFNNNDKKTIIELFYKDDVLDNIKRYAKNIIFKYSILKLYDAYSDYCSQYKTFDFDFIIKIV